MEEDESSRPTIGFPLGLALLLITLFLMTGLFTCCLHWDKLRALLGISADDENSHVQADSDHLPQKSKPPQDKKQKQAQSLPVLMPGDQIPRFVAIYCPSERSALEEIKVIKVQKPPAFPVPLY